MAESIHVNGEAHIRSGTGSSGALEDLGYSVDGVKLRFLDEFEDVKADTGGTRIGVDEQYMGQFAIITLMLVVYDESVLAKWRKQADASAEGLLGTVGRLMGANGHYLRLLILSPVDGLPWNFPTARLLDSHEVEIGTKRNAWALTFKAVAYIGAGVSLGKVLYNRTTS